MQTKYRTILTALIILSLILWAGCTLARQTPSLAPPQLTTRTHKGDLIIETNEQLCLENEKLVVNGNIKIRNGGSFILNKAILVIVNEYKGQHRISADEAFIDIKDSKVYEAENPKKGLYGPEWLFTQLTFSIGGKSSARISNSELHVRIGLQGYSSEDSPKIKVTNSTISFLNWSPRSIARIGHSSIGRAVLDFRWGESENLTVEGLKTGKLEQMTLKTAEGGLLELSDTQIALPWSANFEILDIGGSTIAGKNVTFKNCNFEHIWCKIPPIKERVEIFELPSGHVSLFDFQEHVHGLDLPYNVTLVDCTLKSFKIELQKATVLIRDSYLMFHCHGDGNDAIVKNCRLVNHFNYGSGRVIFDNVTMNGSLELLFCMDPDLRIYGERLGKGGNPNIIFSNSTLKTKAIVVACKNATVSGTVAISDLSLDNVYWYSGTVKRYFPLIVKDREGNPVIDVPVQLLNPRGRAAYVGRTDESGRLVLNIDFTKTNFKKAWRVCTQIEGEKVYREVTFIKSTPLVMQ